MAYPREKLASRYRSMALLEPLNVGVVAALFPIFGWPLTAANVLGFVAVAALLLVGGAYWAAKWEQLRERTELPRGLGFFAGVQWPCLALVLAAVAASVAAGPGQVDALGGGRLAGWLPGAGLAALAVAEQVNYFHVQLSHDNRYDLERLFRAGFRRAKLARDLRAWRQQRSEAAG